MKFIYCLSTFLFLFLSISTVEGKILLGEESSKIKGFRLQFEHMLQRQAWQEAWYFLPSDKDVAEDKLEDGLVEENGILKSYKIWLREQRIELLKQPDLADKKQEYFKSLLQSNLFLEDINFWIKDESKTLEELKNRWRQEVSSLVQEQKNPLLEEIYLKQKEEAWRNKVAHFNTASLVEEEPFFILLDNPEELAEYYNGIGDAVFNTEQSCQLALHYWKKGLSYLEKIKFSNPFQLQIWEELGWTKDEITLKINQCQDALSKEESEKYQIVYEDGQFYRNISEEKKCYFSIPDPYGTASKPYVLGDKVFILGRRMNEIEDITLFVFDVHTGVLLKQIFIVEFFLEPNFYPLHMVYKEGELIIYNPVNSVFVGVHPLTLEVTRAERIQKFVEEYNQRDIKNNVFFYLSVLRTHADHVVRSNAALMLGNVGDPIAIPFLIEALKSDSDHFVKNASLLSLGRLKAIHTIPLIVSFLKNSDMGLRYSAICALGDMAYPSVIEPLMDVLEDPLVHGGQNIHVYWAARDTLRNLSESLSLDFALKEKLLAVLKRNN